MGGSGLIETAPAIIDGTSRPVRILLVDDDPHHQRLIVSLLGVEAPDLDVETAPNAELCLERLERSANDYFGPDLLLLDHEMPPGMNGLQLLIHLRRQGNDIPVIFFTGQGNEEVAAAAFREGAADYFTKSAGFAQVPRLVHSIRRIVKLHRMMAEKRRLVEEQEEIRSVYRDIVERSSDGIVLIANGKIVMGNEAAARMLGYGGPDEYVGTDPMNYIIPEDRRMVKERMVRRLRGEDVPPNYEFRVRNRDGEVLTLQVSSARVSFEGCTALQVVLRDVTGIRRLATRNAESEARLRALFEHGNDAFLVADPHDGRLLDVNPGFCELTGYSREEALGLSLEAVLPSDTYVVAATSKPALETSADGVPPRFRALCVGRDGHRSPVSVTYRDVPEAGWFFIIRDIGAYVVMEHKLHKAHEYLAGLLDSLDVAVVTIDVDGRIEACNEAVYQLLGYRPEELLGREIAALCPGLLPDTGITEDRVETCDHVLVRKDGSSFAAEIRLTVFRNRNGEGERRLEPDPVTRREVLTIMDHSERIRAAERLREKNQELEQFLQVAGHDLKSPLQSILGYCRLLRKSPDIDLATRGEQYVVGIEQTVEQLVALISTLQDYARAGYGAASPTPVEIEEVTRRVFHNLEGAGITENCRLVVEPLPVMRTDGIRLERILQNLIENSCKHRTAGPEHLIRLWGEKAGDWVRLNISDNGPGIPSADQERVFEPFYRRQESEAKGSGIGLAIVKRMVEGLGGTITLESNPGEGTTFHLSLPEMKTITTERENHQ